MTLAIWQEARPLDEISGADLAVRDVLFRAGGHVYRTTGHQIGHGGMGYVYALERIDPQGGPIEPVVAKIFKSEFLYQLRTDEVTRREHEGTVRLLEQITAIGHPNLQPTYVAAPIADNHLVVTPRRSETLLEAVVRGALTPRRRVDLLLGALRALVALHGARILHRDFTLRNILVDDHAERSWLFDFDLALSLDEIGQTTYRERYQGRIFGSPGWSVPPEVLDGELMESRIDERLDVYAVGGAIWALFTDQLPYGPTEDMWGLLYRIAEGVVFHGDCHILYPESVPLPVRPVIERCLERDPGNRYPGAPQALAELEAAAAKLADRRVTRSFDATMRYSPTDRAERLRGVLASRVDEGVSPTAIQRVDEALLRYGYQLQRSLGRVKGHAIYLVTPSPDLLAAGQFPDANTYPKIVTAIDLSAMSSEEAQAVVDRWLGKFLPILRKVRTGLLTALYRGVHDAPSRHLFLFSEYVDDAKFGPALADHELTLQEALGLGFLCARQVARLHEQGLAHNNVRPQALLLKSVRETRRVHPAMVGLVDPSLDPAAMAADVRMLASLVLGAFHAGRIESAEPRARARLEDMRSRLAVMAFSEGTETPGIDWLIHNLSEGLAAVDRNFGVLSRHGGDLDAYVTLLIGPSLYTRLWG